MSDPVLKAFVLCDEIADFLSGSGQKDLSGAGLSVIRAARPLPSKRTFWVYAELTDQKLNGTIQLALMRADSGRRLFFRPISVSFPNQLQTKVVAIRMFECSFPATGVYYVELWYDGEWAIDQRLEVL